MSMPKELAAKGNKAMDAVPASRAPVQQRPTPRDKPKLHPKPNPSPEERPSLPPPKNPQPSLEEQKPTDAQEEPPSPEALEALDR